MAECWEAVDLGRTHDVRLVVWDDCSMGFVCNCGQPDMMVVDGNIEETTCPKCGKRFRLSAQLLVWRGEP